MIEEWKKRLREYRARAEELLAAAETMTDAKARQTVLQDAQLWERMAEWEEKNPPGSA